MNNKSLKLLEKEIKEVNSELEYNLELQQKYPEKEGIKVNQRTLEYVRNQLMERRDETIKSLKIQVELKLEGNEIKNNYVPARILGKIMSSFQATITIIVRYLLEGKDFEGSVTNEIRDKSTFAVSSFGPGSFRVFLVSYDTLSDQTAFGLNPSERALECLNILIGCEDNVQLIKEHQAKFGDNVIERYKNFMYSIYQNKTDVILNNYVKKDIKREKISTDLAKRVYDAIRKTEDLQPDLKTFDGELIALDMIKLEFGFVIAGDPEERIDGKFRKEIKKAAKNNLEKFCTAKFERQKTYHEIKEDYTYKWELIGFEDSKKIE